MEGRGWREEYKYGPHLRKMVLIPGGLLGGGGRLGIWWTVSFGGRDGKLVCWIFGKEVPSWLRSISWLWTVDGKDWHLLYLVYTGQKFRVVVSRGSFQISEAGEVRPGRPFQP